MPENSAKFIKEIRKARGLTQTQMAADGNVCLPTQQNYEAGLRLPTGKYLQALALKGYDIMYLLTGQHQLTLSTEESDHSHQFGKGQTTLEDGQFILKIENVFEEKNISNLTSTEIFKQVRKAKNMTQRDMADAGGVTLPTQQTYEAGSIIPSGRYLKTLAEKGFDIVFLLTGRRQKALLDTKEELLLNAWHKASPDLQQAALRVLGAEGQNNQSFRLLLSDKPQPGGIRE